jgi:hypothetical protein
VTTFVPSQYRVNGDDRAEVTVDWVGEDKWVVRNGGHSCLSNEGLWEYEPLPSNRTDEFKARTRCSLDEAMERATNWLRNPVYPE